MKHGTICEEMIRKLASEGFAVKTIAVEHIYELNAEIAARHRAGHFQEDLYREYILPLDTDFRERMPDARSLIITAAPQMPTEVMFELDKGNTLLSVVPPTYSHDTDRRLEEILKRILSPHHYHFVRAYPPLKLAAVRSGLAAYGKNNITYGFGMGSFHRLAAFYTDLPLDTDSWGEVQRLDGCQRCQACMQACPTGAIAKDRFMIDANRCLTFHNERSSDFPEWIDPAWHNSLVGCMRCQTVCPVNTKWRKKRAAVISFSRKETELILEGAVNGVSDAMAARLTRLGLSGYTDVLGRNLRALMHSWPT